MKKSLLMLLLAVLQISLNAQASDRRDGNWWNDLSEVSKVNYAVGFFDGMELGHNFTIWHIQGMENHKVSPCVEEAVTSYGDLSNEFLKNVTSGQLADGLDAFYKDYRNRSILVHDAVWLVLNEIAGTPHDKVDKMIESWRKNASKN